MKILIDNGHGIGTPGKRSPDGRLREFRYCREIARAVVDRLKALGYDAELTVPEDADISLGQRCARVNAVCDRGREECAVCFGSQQCSRMRSVDECAWLGGMDEQGADDGRQAGRVPV